MMAHLLDLDLVNQKKWGVGQKSMLLHLLVFVEK